MTPSYEPVDLLQENPASSSSQYIPSYPLEIVDADNDRYRIIHEQGLKSPRSPVLHGRLLRKSLISLLEYDTRILIVIFPEQAPRSHFRFENLFSWPMALHLFILALYVTLCIMWALDIERKWIVRTQYLAYFQKINIIGHVRTV